MIENKDAGDPKADVKETKKKRSIVRGQCWVKMIAFVLAAVSALVAVFSGACTIIFGVVDEFQQRPEELQKSIDEQLLYGYVSELYRESGMSSMEGPLQWDALDGGNIRYTVMKENIGEDGSVKKREKLYTNANEVDAENNICSQELIPYMYILGEKRSGFWNVFFDVHRYSSQFRKSVKIEKIVHDQENDLFYAETANGYFLCKYFAYEYETENEGRSEWYTLQTAEDGTFFYENTETQKKWETNVSPKKDGKFIFEDVIDAGFGKRESSCKIEEISRVMSEDILEVSDYGWIEDDSGTFYLDYVPADEENSRYVVYMDVSEPVGTGMVLNCGVEDYFPQAQQLGSFIISFRHISGWFLALAMIVFLVSFAFLMGAAGRKPEDDEIHLCRVDRIPFGILLFIVAGLFGGCILMDGFMVESFAYGHVSFSLALGTGIAFASVGIMFGIGLCMSTAVRIKTKKFWRYTLLYYMCRPIQWARETIQRQMQGRVPMFVKAFIFFGVVTVIEGMVIMAFMYDEEAMFCAFFIYKVLEFAVMMNILYQMRIIKEGGKRIAAGDYSQPIDTSHMLWEFKKHAENINNVGDGISCAVEEKMKSERFRTELITNVSHDIKTPLTSIINYVDLIKKEEIDNSAVQSYIEVLDHQSARLKKLIEDLMEASKASTGNLPVHLESCDATVMLTQVVGEFQERAEENHLELIVESPEPPVNILADGRHLWRIIDNLMSNICKYAQPGTRVYITLEKFGGMVIMTFRNISRSQLNISSEELMERFVRGDGSRNTEGNGLGLSIAKSLATLMNANLAIQIDGDLFKVILSFEEE